MKLLKSFKLSGLVFCLLLLAGLISACGIGRQALVGKWELTDPADPTKLSGTWLDFSENGALTISDTHGISQEISYQFMAETLIRLQDGTFISYQVTGDTLTLGFGSVDQTTGQLTPQSSRTAQRSR